MSDFSAPHEVRSLLSHLPCPWGVAGGWAIDLFLDRVTREHQDIEVAIFREDQLILQEYLFLRGWSFEHVRNGGFHPWVRGERLVLPVHEIWCRSGSGSLTRLEVLLNERVGETFVFRRDFRIKAPIERAFLRSNSGIPILAPEIVLLYKSKRATENKEQIDFANTLEALDVKTRQWLFESIAESDPEHQWLASLRGPNETRAS
jgi:aminoglycoside-2''-adenylyltransferase